MKAPNVQNEPRHRGRMDPMAVAVNALGGRLRRGARAFYCLGVLAKPIVADTGSPLTTVFLDFSVALLVMGLVSTCVHGTCCCA